MSDLLLFSELDVLWYRDPTPWLLAAPDATILAQPNQPRAAPPSEQGFANFGFFAIRSSVPTQRLMSRTLAHWWEYLHRDNRSGVHVAKDQRHWNLCVPRLLGSIQLLDDERFTAPWQGQRVDGDAKANACGSTAHEPRAHLARARAKHECVVFHAMNLPEGQKLEVVQAYYGCSRGVSCAP